MKNMFRLHKLAVAAYVICLAMVIVGSAGAALAGSYESVATGAFYAVIILGLWWWAGALNADTKRIEKRLEKDT